MISSAVGGKRVAPKAAVRRRPPANQQRAPVVTSPSTTASAPASAEAEITALDTAPVSTPVQKATPEDAVPSSVLTSVPRIESIRDESGIESTIQDKPDTREHVDMTRSETSPGAQSFETDQVEVTPNLPQSKTRVRPTNISRSKRKSALTGPALNHEHEGERGGSSDPPLPKPKKRQRKSRKTKDVGAGAAKEGSDVEEREIDPANFSMFELSYSSKRGKTSEREKKMAEIDWVEVARRRQEEVDQIRAGRKDENSHADQVADSTELADGRASATPAVHNTADEGTGIGLRIVNGQIVEDETTLSIDQNAQAHANANNDEEVEEANDLAERLNRTTYLNNRRRDPRERVPVYKSKSDPWTDDETDRFYDALRMFGTDFDIISKMFPPKTRMQVKKKFNREERIDLARINAALLGKENKPMDLEHYAKEVGQDVSVYMKYESYEHASQIIRESMKEREDELAAALQENSETQRQQDIQQKQQEAAQKKKADKKVKAAARKANKGKRPGVGTMGGAGAEEAVVVETTEN